jgi:polar amino acid transport system ATP-binding protein/cystine transport system ATP-binding protein
MGQLFELPNQKYNEKYVAVLRQEIGMVFQRFNLFPHITVRENLVAPLVTIRKMTKSLANANAEKYLKKVGLSDRIDHYPSQLSGGQQQRVAIARALAMEPKIMLFDEATSALDPELVGEVLNVIRELANEGMTMVLVTHEMEFAKDVGDKIIFMDGGLIIEEGSPAEIFTNPRNKRTADFVKKVIH